MKIIDSIYKKVNEEFSNKQRRARVSAEERRGELHQRIPEVKEIDEMLSGTGARIMEAISSGKENFQAKFDMVKAENLRLRKRRGHLLELNGYPVDYDEEKYTCPLCNDSGVHEGKMCLCKKQRYAHYLLEYSGIGELAKKQSFESFRIDLYEEQYRDRIAKNLDNCIRYAEDFDENTTQSLLFVGTTGLGKTHLSTSIAKALIDKGFYVVYVTAQSMITDFSTQRFSNVSEEENEKTAKYYEADLLIIDDLGTELSTAYSVSVIYNVLNSRINRGKPMLISTNLNSKELKTVYADRITSRLFGTFEAMLFEGKDNRMKLRLK